MKALLIGVVTSEKTGVPSLAIFLQICKKFLNEPLADFFNMKSTAGAGFRQVQFSYERRLLLFIGQRCKKYCVPIILIVSRIVCYNFNS